MGQVSIMFTGHDMMPLHLASQHGHADVVKTSLRHTASLTATPMYDLPPVYTASVCGHANVVKLLLDANAVIGEMAMVLESAVYLATTRSSKCW
jgi:ankyrin repeat protein